jgi:hypothetical protein
MMINWIRNIDIRKVAYAIGIMTLVEQGIVSGDAPLAGLMSASALATLVAWCKLLIWVNGFMLIGHTAMAARWPRPTQPGGFNVQAIAALAVLAGIALWGLPAYAASPPPLATPTPFFKAPARVQTPCTQQYCVGPYVGGDILESGGNFNVVSSGLQGLAQNDFAMGGHVGWEFWNGQWFMKAEVGGDYGLVQNGSLPGGGNSALWDAYGLATFGYSLAPIFGLATTGAPSSSSGPLGTLPASLAAALVSPGITIGDWTRPWGSGFATGPSVQALLAQNWTLGVDWLYVNYNNANVNPNVNERSESIVRVAIDRHF